MCIHEHQKKELLNGFLKLIELTVIIKSYEMDGIMFSH